MKNNQFIYETTHGKTKGYFNIYQGGNGKIYVKMGNSTTALTKEQVLELNIHVYELKDFDHDLFNQAYLTEVDIPDEINGWEIYKNRNHRKWVAVHRSAGEQLIFDSEKVFLNWLEDEKEHKRNWG